MTSRTWLNVVLVLVLVVLGLVAFYEPGLQKPAGEAHLTSMKPAQISAIAIMQTGEPDIRLVKDKETWRIQSPVDTAANQVRVAGLLRMVEAPIHAQFPASGTDLAKFGLAQPAMRIKLNDIEIAFGGTEPLNGRRYILMGEAVYVIDDDYHAGLVSGLPGLVDFALVPEGSRLTGIVLPGFGVRHVQEGRWVVTPEQGKLSADAINKWIDEWRHVQALHVGRYEHQKGQGEVVLQFDGEPGELRYLIVSREPEFVLARPDVGMQYHLMEDQARQLLSLPSSSAANNH